MSEAQEGREQRQVPGETAIHSTEIMISLSGSKVKYFHLQQRGSRLGFSPEDTSAVRFRGGRKGSDECPN